MTESIRNDLSGDEHAIVFGPVPSRRLGRSLGINNIPPKVCSYSCTYCQLGRTSRLGIERRPFFEPGRIAAAVERKLWELANRGEGVDHLAFVPDGEPTLDANLGLAIRLLRSFGVPVAVITNGSLLDRPKVREDLGEAAWVSLKVDAVREATWRRINRPHGRLGLRSMLDGQRRFASRFGGVLCTETMLVGGVNDGEADLHATAAFVRELGPAVAYLSVPTRPPAEAGVRPVGEEELTHAWEVFRGMQPRVELLTGYEGEAFESSGRPAADLLAITAVHPMRSAAVARLLRRAGSDWTVVEDLIERGALIEVRWGAHRYYLRPVARGAASPGN